MKSYIEYSFFFECLILLSKYKNLLQITSYRYEGDDEFYQNEIKEVNKYIKKWCQHEYIDDYFETKFENMEKITYCKHCELDK